MLAVISRAIQHPQNSRINRTRGTRHREATILSWLKYSFGSIRGIVLLHRFPVTHIRALL